MLIARELLDSKYGLHINEKEDGKSNAANTALLWATVKGHVKMIELLCEHGADMYVKDKHGNDARDLAMKKHDEAMLKALDRLAPRLGKTIAEDIKKADNAMPGWA